ncbi:UNVERIFIED_ORG: pimeloyl-ACP methyl ester carboxylesterase [Rhodococcus erythropolis]
MSPRPVFAYGIYRDSHARIPIRRWCRDHLQQWDVPHCLSRLDTSLGSTTVLSAGANGALPPVVILPGEELNAATTLAAVCALQRRRRVFVVDLPGQPGLSASRAPDRHRFPAYGRWLDELIPQISAGPVVIVGHSVGAAVALSATPSSRIAGLVLVNPLGIVPVKQSLRFRMLRAKWAIDPSMGNSEQLLAQLLAPRFVPETGLIGWYGLVGQYCIGFRYPRPLPREVMRPWATSRVPVVVAAGAHDRLVCPKRLRGPSSSLLGADVQTIPGCGHLALREAAATVAGLVDSVSASPPSDH